MDNNEIIYFLTTGDIQSVANQELERNLSLDEIETIKDKIADKIDWYDTIVSVIDENIKY